MFEKVLVANRGEIACRIIRAAHCLGMKTVAVYSEADKGMPFVEEADETWALGGALAKDSYLNRTAILEAAKATKAQAIHPGYGFLAEDASFAHAVAQAGFCFVGPSVETMQRIHDKSAARLWVKEAGVPVVPGSNGQVANVEEACQVAAELGYPVLCKAAGGGGGIGMAVAGSEAELRRAFVSCQQRSQAAFGNPGVYLERFFEAPRHIEVQLLGDMHGNCVHLGERECSIQRRHQKLIEEAGSALFEGGARMKLREAMLQAALQVAAVFNYSNAGTVEFLVSGDEFFFIEFNARLQVEHPVTEATTGIDLVVAQFQMAAGMPLPLKQGDIVNRGHAIEFRLCAEDPVKFLPSPGKIQRLEFPPYVRVDSGYAAGSLVTPYYDSLLAKIVVHASSRMQALEKARRALSECRVEGIKTNLPLHRHILEDADFQAGRLTTRFLDHFSKRVAPPARPLKEMGL